MSTFDKLSLGFDLKVFKMDAEFSDADRQCAWELYTEMITRVAITGKRRDSECTDFSGEVYEESFDSMYNFFREAREIMRRFPVGRLSSSQQDHLGQLILRMLDNVVRPFLELWQSRYRTWKAEQPDGASPLEFQAKFPKVNDMLSDWAKVRLALRALSNRVARAYQLVPEDVLFGESQ